jgi:hypothetical protein
MKEAYNQPKFQEFVTAYEKAVEEGKEEFIFYDNSILLTSAKYLIEYLSNTYE